MKHARSIAALFSLLFLFVVAGIAQDSKKETQLRTVHGVVSDKAEKPVAQQRRVPEKLAHQCCSQQFC